MKYVGSLHREWAEAQSASRSGMRGPCVRGKVATGGRGTFRSELMRARRHGPHHQSRSKNYWVRRAGKNTNWSRIRADEWQNGKDDHKRPDTFGIIRLLSVSAVCFHSFLITSQTSQLCTCSAAKAAAVLCLLMILYISTMSA